MLKTMKVTEGSASLAVPSQSLQDPFHCKVFFNPAMRFNRSLSSLSLQASLDMLGVEHPAGESLLNLSYPIIGLS